VRWFGARRADDRLDGGPAAQLAFDLGCHAPFLAGDEDLELVIGRRFVAAVSLVGEDRRLRANPGKSRSMVCSVLSCSATALRMWASGRNASNNQFCWFIQAKASVDDPSLYRREAQTLDFIQFVDTML
jgi:hypothetical protein